MIGKGKEELTTRTELKIRDTGSMKRDMDLELDTLQTDKYSTKASGNGMSIKTGSNAKLFTFLRHYCLSSFAVLYAY